MNRSCGIKVVKYSRPRVVRWMVNYTVWQFIFLSARWCLETSSERDSYCWLAKHVIAKVFLILLLSCAYRKHIDITRVIRTLEEGICMFARKNVPRYVSAFRTDYPRAHLTPSFGSRHLRSAFSASYMDHPRFKRLIFIIDESINAVPPQS